MKKITTILIIMALSLSLLGWVTETAALEDFVYGHDSTLEYDNWLSHVVEGVASAGYNLYAPYDRQLTGFGAYVVPSDFVLNSFSEIAAAINNQQYGLADTLTEATGLPFKLVEFNDTVSGNTYWIIRENLNMNYIDDNGTPDWNDDDERGSFDYGWGLYIINPAAEYPVVITTPHATDDFFTVPMAVKLFRETNAYALMSSGVCREVLYNESSGYYSNSFSLCDPSRQEATVFNRMYQASCDYMREAYLHRELSVQVHSYDWNRHLWYSSCQISAGYGKGDPGIPIRDYSEYGIDIINQGNPVMLEANTVGMNPAVGLNDYYAVNCTTYPFYYTNEDTTFAVNTSVDLTGYSSNRQMLYSCSGWNDHLTYEPFFHIEMDELPNCYPQTTANYYWFFGYDPVTQHFDYHHLFDRAMEFYTPWIESLTAVIPQVFDYNDGALPTPTTPLELVSRNYDRVQLRWEKTNCFDYDSYEILYSEEPIANGNYDVWDRTNDSMMNNSACTSTVILGLNENTEYFFQMMVLDAHLNFSEISNEISTLSGPVRFRYEKAVAMDSLVNFSFNAFHQSENAGFLIYRKADFEEEYSLMDSWQTNPYLVALNGIDNYTYNWTDSLVTNWTRYAYIAASTDSMGNEYWHNYPSNATPFDIYTIHFVQPDSMLTDDIWFGATPNASDGWDADYDIDQDETATGDFVFAEFYETDWNNHQSMIRQIENGYNFDTNLKSWVFRVKSNQIDNDIVIEAQGEFIRDGRKLYLIDQASGQIADLLSEDYTYDNPNVGWRNFTLYWGNILPNVEFPNPATHIYQAGEVASFNWSTSRNYLVESSDIYIVTPTDNIKIGEELPPFFNQTNWIVPEGLLLEEARIVVDLLLIDGDRRQYTSPYKFGCVPSSYAMTTPSGLHLIANPFLELNDITDLLGEGAEIYSIYHEGYEEEFAFFYGNGYFLDSPLGNVTIVTGDIRGGNDQFALQEGWNIVPNPHLTGYLRDDIIIISPGLEMSFVDAVQYELIESAVYAYDLGWHEVEYLYPTEAFLMYCHTSGLQVKFVPYNKNQNTLVREDYDITIRLTASQGSGAEDEVLLAINPQGSDGHDKLYDLPEPFLTPGDNDLNFYTVMDSAGTMITHYNQDTRGSYDLNSERTDWEFELMMEQLEPVTFSLAQNELPEDVVVIMTIGEEEFDLSRDGDFIYEPADTLLSGMISFVPIWMSEDEDTVIPALNVMNYPNPFYYGSTRSDGVNIAFSLPNSSQVKLCIYNIRGQKVTELVNEPYEAGQHTVKWDLLDGKNRAVASGIYFTRLEAAGKECYSKMVVIK